ncbi:MAG: hypothetical protein ACRC8S_20440 [Fimbriiglobus sp.]
MGFRVQLIAIHGKETAQIHREYSVAATGEFEELPESPVIGAELPNGRYLLFINDEILPDKLMFARLSRDAALVACYVNETIMESSSCCWTDGIEQWFVLHDSQQATEHLEVTGILPGEFEPIRDKLLKMQMDSEGEDYLFEIPVELFAAFVGYRHDQDIQGVGSKPWQILKRVG